MYCFSSNSHSVQVFKNKWVIVFVIGMFINDTEGYGLFQYSRGSRGTTTSNRIIISPDLISILPDDSEFSKNTRSFWSLTCKPKKPSMVHYAGPQNSHTQLCNHKTSPWYFTKFGSSPSASTLLTMNLSWVESGSLIPLLEVKRRNKKEKSN